jgi:CheY-like chemotaxis protein
MSRIKILVADDDPDILNFHRLALSEFFDLVMARDGLEAWKFFELERPRLVLTDLNMPGINGMDLTDKIRAHPELGETPVIILTGTTRNTDLPPGFWRLGTQADLLLEKPITPSVLVNEIRRVLAKRQEASVKPVVPRYLE